MKKEVATPYQFNSISELHRVLGLPKPLYPLVSLVDNTTIAVDKSQIPVSFFLNFYKISYKKGLSGHIKYGQNYYDFSEGGLVFTSPNQLLATTDDTEYMGHTLLIHPDFIRNYPLAKNITNMGFFSYAANEALHLSEKEKSIIIGIFNNIEDELQSPIDDFSQDVIITQIELLLNTAIDFINASLLPEKQ